MRRLIWAVSSGSTRFDIQSLYINFFPIDSLLKKKKKKKKTSVVRNFAPTELMNMPEK